MEYKRASDHTGLGMLKNRVLRIRTEIALLLMLSIAILFIPHEARLGLLGLFITKGMFVTMGVLYAHASRKFMFPFLDMEKMLEEHHWGGLAFVTVYYFVIIYAFAVGG
jgi:hypothetical protein